MILFGVQFENLGELLCVPNLWEIFETHIYLKKEQYKCQLKNGDKVWF